MSVSVGLKQRFALFDRFRLQGCIPRRAAPRETSSRGFAGSPSSIYPERKMK
jgi:hypothetical protein